MWTAVACVLGFLVARSGANASAPTPGKLISYWCWNTHEQRHIIVTLQAEWTITSRISMTTFNVRRAEAPLNVGWWVLRDILVI